MKLHITTPVLFLSFCLTVCKAQTSDKVKYDAFSFELGKTGFIYNLTFDHKFQSKNYGFRIGFGGNPANYLSIFSAGGGGYYLIGKKNNYFELGIDLSYLTVDESSDDQRGVVLFYPDYPIKTYYASMNLGYKHYGHKNMFRIGISPGFFKTGFLPGGYVSFGLAIP